MFDAFEKDVTPAKAGVQSLWNLLKLLDAGFSVMTGDRLAIYIRKHIMYG
jgi:hypothetical protein